MDLSYDLLNEDYAHEFSQLDFRENDNSDPLGVHDFANTKALAYHYNKISTVRIVKSGGKIVAYFAVSMSAINITKLSENEKVNQATPITYPAVLLGQLGVDKGHRGKGIGQQICTFCIGLAQEVSDKIACRYIILQTNVQKTALYEKMGFIKSPKKPDGNNKIWMYMRIV